MLSVLCFAPKFLYVIPNYEIRTVIKTIEANFKFTQIQNVIADISKALPVNETTAISDDVFNVFLGKASPTNIKVSKLSSEVVICYFTFLDDNELYGYQVVFVNKDSNRINFEQINEHRQYKAILQDNVYLYDLSSN